MTRNSSIAFTSVAAVLICGGIVSVFADEISWPRKTGPTANGVVAAVDATALPIEWDEASGKNIAWKIPIEGIGHSTPVVGNKQVWFTSASEDGKKQYVYSISTDDLSLIHI